MSLSALRKKKYFSTSLVAELANQSNLLASALVYIHLFKLGYTFGESWSQGLNSVKQVR